MNGKMKALTRLMDEAIKEVSADTKPAERIPQPKLPTGILTTEGQWRSLLWSIDTAESHGSNALAGLTQALARIVQAEILRGLLFDARQHKAPASCPQTLLWDTTIPIRADGSTMDDLLRRESGAISLNLAHSAVIPQPWERWRLARALQNIGPIGKHGNWRQTTNTHAVAWTPWPLAWIDNGNHSAMAAIVTHGGMLEVSETYDATELLLSVYTDGKDWIRIDNGDRIEPVRSLAMAGIFEIGRRLVGAPRLV